MNAENREQEGYEKAQAALYKGEDAQTLLNQSLGDCEPNDFTRGWQKACEDAGAKHPEDR